MGCNIVVKDLSFLPRYNDSVKICAVYNVDLCMMEIKAYHVMCFGFDE